MKDYVPYSWISLSQVKREHYKALAHFYVALGLLEHHGDHFSTRAEELLQVKTFSNRALCTESGR